jgi:tRNA wybutosine-synthesizing protein 1
MVEKKVQEEENFVKSVLNRQHYEIVGSAGVQVCRWAKNSLNKKGVCWKEKFYGIKSHRCCQFSPAVMWCENQCLHCWRPIEMNLGTEIGKIDDPKKLLDGIVEARKKLLMGFKGNKKISKKKFEEALEPSLFTLSLSGEPTIYPRLPEMINEIRKRKAVSFLVTNGQNPEMIKKLDKEHSLPTQLTVSTNAPNEELFTIWHRSCKKNAWKKFNETLALMKKLKRKTRTAMRFTLVKAGIDKGKFKDLSNMKEEHISQYVTLIKKADPMFIHVKGYMSVGWARERMGYDKQPWHYEIKRFVEKLLTELNNGEKEKYKVLGEEDRSCVVVIGKNKRNLKINMKKV